MALRKSSEPLDVELLVRRSSRLVGDIMWGRYHPAPGPFALEREMRELRKLAEPEMPKEDE